MVKRLATYARTSAELLIKLLKGETPEKWPVRLTLIITSIAWVKMVVT